MKYHTQGFFLSKQLPGENCFFSLGYKHRELVSVHQRQKKPVMPYIRKSQGILVFKDAVSESLVVLLCVLVSVLESHTLFTNAFIPTEEGRANLLHGEK